MNFWSRRMRYWSRSMSGVHLVSFGHRMMLTMVITILLWTPPAGAQKNLGEVLDAGAKVLSPEEFNEQIVQSILTGPTPIGGTLEIMYARNGMLQGEGLPP